MRQLGIVFRFEFLNYVRRKGYIALTVILLVAMGVALTLPRLLAGGGQEDAGEVMTVALVDNAGGTAGDAAFYTAALAGQGYEFAPAQLSRAEAEGAVANGEYESVVFLEEPLHYTRVVRNLGMYDDFSYAFDAAMLARYQTATLEAAGLSAEAAGGVLNAEVSHEAFMIAEGKDQMQNFMYTYILIFILYMAIILYGQFVASSVATEKSTRAMELLITSARPASLMFGKVLGAGCAGLAQLFVLLFAAFGFYNLNHSYYADNPLIQSIFSMPVSMVLYTLLFFVLGFFIYAFLFAALASLVSRMEDLSTAIAPVTYLFVAAFMVVVFSISSGQVDNPAMVFCSYFPLTSPMAMFARVALSDIAFWKVLVSLVILVGSTIGIGFLSAAIYRLGVLLYGNPPKPAEVLRLLRAAKAGG